MRGCFAMRSLSGFLDMVSFDYFFSYEGFFIYAAVLAGVSGRGVCAAALDGAVGVWPGA